MKPLLVLLRPCHSLQNYMAYVSVLFCFVFLRKILYNLVTVGIVDNSGLASVDPLLNQFAIRPRVRRNSFRM
jgi:hypothetical protein